MTFVRHATMQLLMALVGALLLAVDPAGVGRAAGAPAGVDRGVLAHAVGPAGVLPVPRNGGVPPADFAAGQHDIHAAGPAQPAADQAAAIRRERIILPGFDEAHTPPELNRTAAFRYPAAGPALPDTVLILIPGLNSGPNTLDLLARALVAARPGLEVWIQEPRATLLQDRRGIGEALTTGVPDFALAYYYGRLPIRGRTYTPLDLARASYAAYWGLDLHLRDIQAVVRTVRQRYPRARVLLGGHSLGAILAAAYAGYDFARTPSDTPVRMVGGRPAPSPGAGWKDLAGLLMLDGVPLNLFPRFSPDQYLNGATIPFVARLPGVTRLTAADPARRVEPFTDTSSLGRTQDSILFDTIAVYARLRPNDASRLPFWPRKGLAITNEALFAAVLSDQMQPHLLVRASLGTPLGVFERMADNARVSAGLLNLQTGRPAPGEPLIRWIPYDRSTPRGHVDLGMLLDAVLRPGGDFTQWYTPWRLLLDLGLAAGLDTSDAFARQYLSLTQIRDTRLPVLILGAGRGLIRRVKATTFYREHIDTPAELVHAEILPDYTHLDIEDAVDNAAVARIVAWINGGLR